MSILDEQEQRGRRPAVVVITAILVAALGFAVVSGVLWLVARAVDNTPSPVGDPDPGGQLMAQLKPALQAIPSTVHRYDVQYVEPMWDSCDGIRSSYGWSNVVVIAQFDKVTDPDQVQRQISTYLVHHGWSQAPGSGDGQWGWTRTLSNGSLATIQLLGGPTITPSEPWDFQIEAPPAVHPVKGC